MRCEKSSLQVTNLADVEWVILSNKIMFLQLRDLNYMSQLVPIDGSPGVPMWPLGSLIRPQVSVYN